MKFVKWRTMWAWGYSPSKKGPEKGWHWKTFPDDFLPSDIRAWMEAQAEKEGGHSDKFRKIEWVRVKNPPLEVVSKKYSEACDAVGTAEKRMRELAQILGERSRKGKR